MKLQTKILFASVFLIAGAAAFADVTAKDTQAVNFAPAAEAPKKVEADDQAQLTVRDEVADDQTEGGSCQIACHPVFNFAPKTALAKFDLNKIK